MGKEWDKGGKERDKEESKKRQTENCTRAKTREIARNSTQIKWKQQPEKKVVRKSKKEQHN